MLGGGDPDCRPARGRRVCSGPSLVGSWLGDPVGLPAPPPRLNWTGQLRCRGGSRPAPRAPGEAAEISSRVSVAHPPVRFKKSVERGSESRGPTPRGACAPRSRIVQGRSGPHTLSRHPRAPGQTAPSQGWRGKRSHPFLLSCWTSVKGSMQPQSRICCPQGKVTAVQTDREVAAKVWAPARLSSSQASVSPQRSEALS